MLLTRSPLEPHLKDGASFDLHVLSTPPAFVLSQDQTLRKKCGVADASHKRVVMSLTTAVAYTERRPNMTELFNPRPVHEERGSGSSNEGSG